MNNSSEFGVRSSEWEKQGRMRCSNPHSALRIPHSLGFTLLEVLIAVAIMSVLVTVVYTSFSTAGRNVEQAETKRDATDLARVLVSKLSNDITNAYYNPLMTETVFLGKKSSAAGEEQRFDSISLTTLTNWRKPNSKESELWEVSYRFDEQPDKSNWVMVRTEKREPNKEQLSLEGGTDYVLTDRIQGFRLRYSDGITWVDEWDSKARQSRPKAVEIALELTDGSFYITRAEVGR